MSGSLKDKVVLVTGSSHGIGAAIAARFAEHGAKVVVHGRDAEATKDVTAGIVRAGAQAIGVTADVTSFDDVERMRHVIEDEIGPVDVLVANAGGNPVPPGPLEDVSEEGFRAAVDANLTATFLTIKSFLPGMKERRAGNIITVSSAAGRRANPRSPIPYAAAKAGIQILTQDVAAQAGPFGVRVNCLAPETIMTERNQQQIPANVQEQLAGMHPLQRLGTPEDVARAAIYLASDESSWITGVILDIAGGATMV
jgi:3-oxoacyl-[acyl-carrier protein] reductase